MHRGTESMPTDRQRPDAPRGAAAGRPGPGKSQHDTVSAMPPASLAVPLVVLSFLLAAAAIVAAVRNRKPGNLVWLVAIPVEAMALAVVVAGVVKLTEGGHPREYATFIGYLIA